MTHRLGAFSFQTIGKVALVSRETATSTFFALNSTCRNFTSMAGGKKIEEIYQKKTQLEHILLRPDTYIGSVEFVNQAMWVLDANTRKMVYKSINFVPGLYKIFDEILVNAADNKVLGVVAFFPVSSIVRCIVPGPNNGLYKSFNR